MAKNNDDKEGDENSPHPLDIFNHLSFQLMAVTASAYLVAWGPFSVLCIWEMVVQPKVLLNHGHDGDG